MPIKFLLLLLMFFSHLIADYNLQASSPILSSVCGGTSNTPRHSFRNTILLITLPPSSNIPSCGQPALRSRFWFILCSSPIIPMQSPIPVPPFLSIPVFMLLSTTKKQTKVLSLLPPTSSFIPVKSFLPGCSSFCPIKKNKNQGRKTLAYILPFKGALS